MKYKVSELWSLVTLKNSGAVIVRVFKSIINLPSVLGMSEAYN
jgi:hypothetical protein